VNETKPSNEPRTNFDVILGQLKPERVNECPHASAVWW